MKKYIAGLFFMFAFSANANLISIELDKTDVDVGDTISVTLNATGFDSFDQFGLNVLFDTSLFAYETGSFSSILDTTSSFGVLASADPIGLVLSFFDFFPAPGGDVELGRFQVTALTAGAASFSLENFGFFSAGSGLDVDSSSQVAANVTDVPAPSAFGLMLIGGLALMGMRRRAK